MRRPMVRAKGIGVESFRPLIKDKRRNQRPAFVQLNFLREVMVGSECVTAWNKVRGPGVRL